MANPPKKGLRSSTKAKKKKQPPAKGKSSKPSSASSKSSVKKTGKLKVKARSTLMDANHPALIPTVLSQGNAFALTGVVRQELALAATDTVVYCITNTGRSGTVAARISNNGSTPSTGIFTIPLLAAADDVGGPTSGRAMKCTVELVNVTAPLYMGGRIYVLNAHQRVPLLAEPSVMTITQQTALIDSIKSHPDCRSYAGTDFVKPYRCHSEVVDHDLYTGYGEWKGTDTVTTFMAHSSIWPGLDPLIRPMSAMWIVFQRPAANQDYTLSFKASYYTRWPLNTVPGTRQTPVPTAPAHIVNAATTVRNREAGGVG